jgi:hypothetical protein
MTMKTLTPEEREIIAALERSRGRKLTRQEINLSLEQARHIGELEIDERLVGRRN